MSFGSPFPLRSARLLDGPRGPDAPHYSHLEQGAHAFSSSTRRPPSVSRNTEPPLFLNNSSDSPHISKNDDLGRYWDTSQAPRSSQSVGHRPRASMSNRFFFSSDRAHADGVAHTSTSTGPSDTFSEVHSSSLNVHNKTDSYARTRHGQRQNASLSWEPQKVVFKKEQSQEDIGSSFLDHSIRSDARESSSVEGNGLNHGTISENRGDPLAVMLEERLASLQSVKNEAEEQRRENIQLTSELTSLRNENADLLRRLNDLRTSSLKALDVKSKSLLEVQNALSSLKAQSRESFTLVNQARGAMSDVEDLRRIVSESTGRLEVLLDGDGNITKLSEAREVVNELQLECTTTRQANDLLRDKLTEFSSQVAEARDRIRELESGRDKETHALSIALKDLSDSNAIAKDHAEKIRRSQADLSDALVACARSQDEVSRLEEMIHSLTKELHDKASGLKELDILRQENVELRTLLKARHDNSVVELNSMKNEILASMSQSYSVQDMATIDQLTLRCAGLEAELELRKKDISFHNGEMKEAASREQAVLLLNQKLTSEKKSSEERIKTLELEARSFKEELRSAKDKLQQVQLRCQVLQERFDDQSTTLKLVREAHGDVQERLLAAEKTFTSNLEVETAKRQQEIAVLSDRNSFLLRTLDETKKGLKYQQDLHVKAQCDYEDRLKAERDSAQIHILAAQEKQLQAQYARNRAVEDTETARTSTSAIQEMLDDVKAELREASMLSVTLESNISGLRTQIEELQTENTRFLERQSTLDARYRTNELTDVEKAFVDGLLAESQSFFDKKLADKQNEVKRKVAIISSLESKIATVEKSLARHLKNEQAAKKAAISDGQSLVNIGHFAGQSSSDTGSGPGRQRQHATANLDDTSPTRFEKLAALEGPSGGRKSLAQGPAIDSFRTPKSAGPHAERARFTTLGESEHDDILQFDDQSKPGSPHSLGKRSRTSSQNKGEENSDVGRPRTRQKSYSKKAGPRSGEGKKHVPVSKPTTRKRAR